MKIGSLRHRLVLAGIAGIAVTVVTASAAAQGLNINSKGRTPGQPRIAPVQRPPAAPPPDAQPAPSRSTSIAPAAASQIVDQIAAVVNGEIITRNELRDRVDQVRKGLARQGTQLPPDEVLERQVLERMIVEQAQLQMASDNGVRVDDVQLDRAIQRIAESNNMSVQAFRDRVESEGTSFAKFRDEVRGQIMMERVRAKEVDEKIQVGEGEVDAFIAEQNGASPDAAGEVDIAQILVRVPEQATPEQIEQQRAKADDLYRQAVGGADFGRLAASYSDGPEALQGGDLGFRSQDRLPQLFVDAIAPLSAGEVAKPVKSANGFHILKLVSKRNAQPVARAGAASSLGTQGLVEQTRARHILIKTNEIVSADQARARLEDIRARIVNKTASFEDMARAYSNDASASRGGDLGLLYPGDTVPEFEAAMNALQPGEVSQPVQSPFGLHLIEVVERKKQDVAQDRLRLLARQAIRDRKIDEATESWLRELRDRAYVEMRIDSQ